MRRCAARWHSRPDWPNRSLEVAPNLWLTHLTIGLLHMREGKIDDGFASIRRAASLSDASSRPRSVLGFELACQGETAEARKILDGLLDESQTRYITPTSIASLHAALGEQSLALSALEEAYRTKDTRIIFLKDDPHWLSLRSEPRFKALMKMLKVDHFGRGLTPI